MECERMTRVRIFSAGRGFHDGSVYSGKDVAGTCLHVSEVDLCKEDTPQTIANVSDCPVKTRITFLGSLGRAFAASVAAFAGIGPLTRPLSHNIQERLSVLAFCLNR